MKYWLIRCLSFILLLAEIAACNKTSSSKPAQLTPLQAYVNADTTLTLFRRMILQANEAVLLGNDAVTVLMPDNAAFRSIGYTEDFIDSLGATFAGNMIQYHFLNGSVTPAAGAYIPYPGLTGFVVYGMKDSSGTTWFNGTTVKGPGVAVGNALVYKLSTPLQGPTDSLNHLLSNDPKLTFLTEAFKRTNLYDSALLTARYTLLAPTDSAFMAAGYDSVGAIDSVDSTQLVNLLKEHVLPGLYFTNTLRGMNSVTNLAAGAVSVSFVNGLLQFAGPGNTRPAHLVNGNQMAGDSIVVHKIDQLLSFP